MNTIKRYGCLIGILLVAMAAQASPTALFYMTRDPGSVRSFLAHYRQIDLIVPTWYEVDENGLVTGGPDPLVLETAHGAHLPVMPIVALFNKQHIHALVGSQPAQDRMNEAMIRESKLHGYSGFQFDFENVSWMDRDAFTALVRRSADALHKAGLQISIATVPNAPGYPPGESGYARWMFTDWRGGYDIAELARSVDLLCLMTYDQQTRWTPPGPVSGWQWTIENLDYALKVVPREKLSLGIPLYGYHWYAGTPTHDGDSGEDKPNPTAKTIDSSNAQLLARTWKTAVQWDPVDRTAWFWFYRDQVREWVFFTDQRTFEERYRLVKDRDLEGFCSWVLGEEDPEIWKVLPERR